MEINKLMHANKHLYANKALKYANKLLYAKKPSKKCKTIEYAKSGLKFYPFRGTKHYFYVSAVSKLGVEKCYLWKAVPKKKIGTGKNPLRPSTVPPRRYTFLISHQKPSYVNFNIC